MLKNRLLILAGLFVGSCLCITGLYFLTEYKSKLPNAFIRKLPSHLITAENVKDLKNSNMYIAGRNGNFFYLGNHNFKNLLYRLDLKTLDTSRIFLTAPKDFKVFEDATIRVDSTDIFLMDGLKAKVSTGSVSNYALIKNTSTPFFTACIPMSRNTYLFRSVNKKKQNILVKQRIDNKSIVIKDRILEKQVDGFFCTDGIFINVPYFNRVFYIYYYRNQFIATDTNLNVLYTGKTIDTISHAKIKLGKIKSENQITMTAPPVYVNKKACANENYLFINSALKADNETDSMHNSAVPIDVYAVKDGKYQFSFYLPDFNGIKMTDFKVYGKTLVVLFGHYVYTFQLNF